jgi:hypothetical protein
VPLSVEIKINGREIETLHIGRTEDLWSNNQVSDYLVSTDPRFESEDTKPFKHKYSEGAVTCVRKALEAYERTS